MDKPFIPKQEFIRFMKWCLPQLNLCWSGFRKVHRTVRKRVGRRIHELGLPDLESYRKRLGAEPSEWLELDRMCRIPISRFYRDKGVYEALTFDILPCCADIARGHEDKKIRVLSAGCASGEEPFTVSLIWHLCVSVRFPDVDLQVLAIDIDDSMLRRARTACYSLGSFRDLPDELKEKGFNQHDGKLCMRDAFRDGVQFEKMDLRVEVPPGPFDLIFCRNTVFTYFDALHQVQVYEKLDKCLRNGGFIVIGSHEALPPHTSGYVAIHTGIPVFKKVSGGSVSRCNRSIAAQRTNIRS